MIISAEAAAALKSILVSYCAEAGLGFRISGPSDDSQALTISIKVDKPHEGDHILSTNGIKIFIDPDSFSRIRDFKLEYTDEPEKYFIFSLLKDKSKIEYSPNPCKKDSGNSLN
jgi:Fe-S cluster assembly iron-binding protein IscA